MSATDGSPVADTRSAGGKQRLALTPIAWIGWVVFALVVANTLIFAFKVANPLVISDGWHYLDTFVRKAADGSLSPGDFFAKRTGVDHSMPLQKLLLLANYRYFGLDFALDALVGLGFAIATLLLIRRAIHQATGEAFMSMPVQLAFVAICAVYLSLNASVIYEWPLLTMGFCAQFFFVLLFICSWRACIHGRYVALASCALGVLVIADDSGIIAVIACLLGLLILALHGWQRPRTLMAAALLVCSILAYKIGYMLLAPAFSGAAKGLGIGALTSTPHLLSHLVAWMLAPLSASILHPVQTQQIFGSQARVADIALALLVASAHIWFWWQAFRRKPTVIGHVAVCTMLVFYGLWAGILLARVADFGDAAFNQPRYVMFYQLNIIALLLMGISRLAIGEPIRYRARAAVLAVACGVLLLVQIPVTMNGWKREPFEHHYVAQLASQMDQLAANPETPPADCLPQLTVCRMPAARRQELMALLKGRRLNLFSPTFRQLHELPPSP